LQSESLKHSEVELADFSTVRGIQGVFWEPSAPTKSWRQGPQEWATLEHLSRKIVEQLGALVQFTRVTEALATDTTCLMRSTSAPDIEVLT
jgi:hypothetical protein